MSGRRALLSDGKWAAIGQVASALGALATVRLLTELLVPEAYGSIALLMGAVLLGQGLLATPVLQGVLRLHVDGGSPAETADLYRAAFHLLLRRTALTCAGVAIALGVLQTLGEPIPAAYWLAVALLAAETLRIHLLTVFNAERRQRAFALWNAADACAKPLAAAAGVFCIAPSSTGVFLGYLAASIATDAGMLWAHRRAPVGLSGPPAVMVRGPMLALADYSRPLVPLALIGWMNGMVDRYAVAGSLGLAEAGIYAAIYGLVSRPFLMLGQIVEQTLRQAYYASAARSGDPATARRIFLAWLGLVAVAAVCALLVVAVWHRSLAASFLGPAFRHASDLMPWVACAYCLLALSQVIERRHYADLKPGRVLTTHLLGVVTLCLASLLLIPTLRIYGAACALILSALAQLIFGAALIYRGRQTTQTRPEP